MRVVVGGRVKNWYFSLKGSEWGGISEIKKQNKKKKKEHSEIKQFGNNNNSVPKSKFEKGEVLRWSLRKKNPAAHTVPTWYSCVKTLLKTHKKPVWFKRIYFDSFTTCITYYNMQIFRIRTKAYCLFSSSPKNLFTKKKKKKKKKKDIIYRIIRRFNSFIMGTSGHADNW